MFKLSVAFFSYIGLLLFSFFGTEEILVENNTPAMIAPGSRTLVQVTVSKGDVQGFSKLEISLPIGFTASPADTKGASFTFSAAKAKFVWMTLPSEQSFTVTYYLEAPANIEGPYEINGQFSYVKSNKRMDIDIPVRTVVLKKGVEPSPEQVATMLPELRREAPVVDMVCERTLTKISDTEYQVNLKVTNNKITGFGKILEILPDNCSSSTINDGGAVITQDEHSIKFVWFEVPVAPSFEVSYKITCASPIADPVITGQLSYTEEGNPVSIAVVQTGSSGTLANNQTAGSGQDTAVNNTTEQQNTGNADTVNNSEQNNTTNTAQNDTQTQNPVNSTDVAQNTQSDSERRNESNSSQGSTGEKELTASKGSESPAGVPSPETGITYKVQIMAAHRVVNKKYLSEKFAFEDQYNIENHEGWVKYTTGKYTTYKDARDARVKITQQCAKLPGPFVTAYNDGERITVQEALLISKQVWFK